MVWDSDRSQPDSVGDIGQVKLTPYTPRLLQIDVRVKKNILYRM